MATTNLISKSFGDIAFQYGNGVPNHVASIYSTYIDLDSGLKYENQDSGTTWEAVTAISLVDGITIDYNTAGELTIIGGTAPVDSVNSKIGIVVLDADDISDAATTNKFVTAGDLTTLSNTSGTNTGDEVTFAGPGTSGNVPDPTTTTGKFLKDDGTWVTIPSGGDMLSTNNLSDVANATTSFDNIKQSATLVYEGTIELATQAEVDAGVDAVRAVTPATLAGSDLIGGNPEFGEGYAYVSNDTQSDTALTTLQTKAILTTGSLISGVYMVSWQAEIATSATNRSMEVLIEDNTATVIGNSVFRPGDVSEWSSFSGMIQQNISGVHNFTMKWRAIVGGTASIRRARISVWRVG